METLNLMAVPLDDDIQPLGDAAKSVLAFLLILDQTEQTRVMAIATAIHLDHPLCPQVMGFANRVQFEHVDGQVSQQRVFYAAAIGEKAETLKGFVESLTGLEAAQLDARIPDPQDPVKCVSAGEPSREDIDRAKLLDDQERAARWADTYPDGTEITDEEVEALYPELQAVYLPALDAGSLIDQPPLYAYHFDGGGIRGSRIYSADGRDVGGEIAPGLESLGRMVMFLGVWMIGILVGLLVLAMIIRAFKGQ